MSRPVPYIRTKAKQTEVITVNDVDIQVKVIFFSYFVDYKTYNYDAADIFIVTFYINM